MKARRLATPPQSDALALAHHFVRRLRGLCAPARGGDQDVWPRPARRRARRMADARRHAEHGALSALVTETRERVSLRETQRIVEPEAHRDGGRAAVARGRREQGRPRQRRRGRDAPAGVTVPLGAGLPGAQLDIEKDGVVPPLGEARCSTGAAPPLAPRAVGALVAALRVAAGAVSGGRRSSRASGQGARRRARQPRQPRAAAAAGAVRPPLLAADKFVEACHVRAKGGSPTAATAARRCRAARRRSRAA